MTTAIALVVSAAALMAQQEAGTRDRTVRAAYLAANPAHAVKDPTTGEPRGVVIDLVHEFGRRRGVPVSLIGLENPQRVIDAVRSGDADIGFVAYNPERAGPVEFSQPYLLVQQTFLVTDGSPVRAIADIDRQGRKLGATRADSIALYLRRTLTQAELVELDGVTRESVLRLLRDGEIDAFGANRQRLTDMQEGIAGFRLLPDDLYGVEQTIIVPSGQRDALDEMNRFIDDVQRTGFLRESIARSGVVGIAVAERR